MDIGRIDDLDTAKHVASLLDKELERVYKKLGELTKVIAKLRGAEGTKQLELQLMRLTEQKGLLQRRLFSRSSEKRSREKDAKETKKHPGHGPRAQPELPTSDVVHPFDRDVGEESCAVCGGNLEEWEDQYKESEEITVVQRKYVLLKHKRARARCRCYAKIVTAWGPIKVIPGGRYSLDFAVTIAVDKYLDHLPLNRQRNIMEREGLDVDANTLWDQIDALAAHLKPTYDALRAYILRKPLLHADETPWYLLKGRPAKKHYMWCVAVESAAYYWIRDSRGADAAKEVLGNYKGIVMADGYKAYSALAKKMATPFTLVFCWSHCRRKYREAEQFYPQECEEILDLIGELYGVEKCSPNPALLAGEERQQALALRAELREEKSRPVVDSILEWATAQTAEPGSALRDAIAYMLGLWPGLLSFLANPLIPLDNNLVERQMRGPVVGRKNHYGSKSERGTEVAAILYSLLETAKLVGVEPRSYLTYAARIAIANPGTSVFPHELLSTQSTIEEKTTPSSKSSAEEERPSSSLH